MTKSNRLEVAREQRMSRAWGIRVGGECSPVSDVDQVCGYKLPIVLRMLSCMGLASLYRGGNGAAHPQTVM